MSKIDIQIENKPIKKYEAGITVGSLLTPEDKSKKLPYIAAIVNNDLASLSYPITVNSSIRFITMLDPNGWRVYRNSVSFLLAKAVKNLFQHATVSIDYSLGLGLFCSFKETDDAPDGISDAQLGKLYLHMKKLVESDLAINRIKIAYTDAIKLLEESGKSDTASLLAHRNPPNIVMHECDGFCDLAHGPLVTSTKVLTCFELINYTAGSSNSGQVGFILNLPERCDVCELKPFDDQPHLAKIFREHTEWGRILGVTTTGKLNEIIAANKVKSFIHTAEALHEKKISNIADKISSLRDTVKFVLIAGPSSAGKTTFAKRLSVQLRVNGLHPITLSTDDYFVGDARNPKDKNGKPDYEHVEAVDIKLFNEHLNRLAKGEKVEIPRFNFEIKKQEFRGNFLQVRKNTVVIIEGIHALNPVLTAGVAAESKFKIYVSALTQMSIDSNNRISTTDNRLLRRMVRDNNFRGHSALATLRMWPSVRRGEKKWIFPFQKEADETFNSALDYEMAVLKPIAEPLLAQVKPSEPEYAESRRLTEFLLNFRGISDNNVPNTSILREYVGKSDFDY